MAAVLSSDAAPKHVSLSLNLSEGVSFTQAALSMCFPSSSNTSSHHHTACLSSSSFLPPLYFLFLPSLLPHGFASAPQSVSLSFILSSLPTFLLPNILFFSASCCAEELHRCLDTFSSFSLHLFFFVFLVFSSLYAPSPNPSHPLHPPSCLTLCLIKAPATVKV